MAECSNCHNEVSKPQAKLQNTFFTVETYTCDRCGRRFTITRAKFCPKKAVMFWLTLNLFIFYTSKRALVVAMVKSTKTQHLREKMRADVKQSKQKTLDNITVVPQKENTKTVESAQKSR